MSRRQQYKIDMCSGPILSKMMLFAVPLMFSSILQLLFNAADIVVVGRFAGDNSMAAVGSVASLVNLLVNFFMGLSVGANVMAARYFAAKNDNELSKTVHTSIVVSLIGGVILSFVGFFFSKSLLRLMSSPPDIIDLAALYLKLFFLGMPANLAYNFGSALLRAVGDTRRPLYFLSFAGVVNVILNLIFVIKFHMGVAGVAIATVVAQCISAFLVLRCLTRESAGLQLSFSKLRIDGQKLVQIMKVGLPASFQGILFSLSNVVIQSTVNGFGEVVVAGASAASNIEGFVYASMNSVYQATISFSSQNAGVGNFKRVRRVTLTGAIYTAVLGITLGMICIWQGKNLIAIYSNSPDVIEMGFVRLSLMMTMYFLCGVMDTMVGALRGIGYSIAPMIVSLIGVCGLRLIWIATIVQIPRFHTIEMVYASYPVTWIITLIAHVICFRWAIKKAELLYGMTHPNMPEANA